MITRQPFPFWGVVGILLILFGFYAMDIGFFLDALWVIGAGVAFVFIGLVVSIM
ncbi:Uncharacterised protein [Serratia ficaria]|uniref:hypothetical protein n=1 Tax=Serratia ficaria TaxID=61651 RepID=UPI002179F4B5|nr:hypothetical protein [Serratia ficaria]CAI1974478.1 Uncharacterised protein [Serratia ficaria]CAI2080425.1 Uncharacterised protein [Serratia ficaria]CAI2489939.1 Uncharacterised protein [Serratia ficaria]